MQTCLLVTGNHHDFFIARHVISITLLFLLTWYQMVIVLTETRLFARR
jgi:hypothetical protein